jgi:deoxyribodipyrimidine photolyase-related protein
VAWVEEPNTLGMALNAWPGMTSKPYCASGAYIDRMSDYCRNCRYNPKPASARRLPVHHAVLGLPRPPPRPLRRQSAHGHAAENLDRLGDTELTAIRHQATSLRADLDGV